MYKVVSLSAIFSVVTQRFSPHVTTLKTAAGETMYKVVHVLNLSLKLPTAIID